MLLFLPCAILALSTLALPPTGVISLLLGNTSTLSTSHTTHPIPTTTTATTTRSSTSPLSTPPPPTTNKLTSSSTILASTRSESAQTTPPPTPSISPTPIETHAIVQSSKTWQIIGIAIIAVLFVAVSLTCAMFFERLWRLFKDIVCCASRSPPSEELIPDCEKQTWASSPSPSDHNDKPLRDKAPMYTIRSRELPWNADTPDWNSLHRQPSRRNSNLLLS